MAASSSITNDPAPLLRSLLVVAVVLALAPERAALAEQLLPGREIRYTSGSVQSSGWEQGLLEGTPNLGHFYWSPITSYSQNYRKAPLPVNQNLKAASRQPLKLRPAGSIYVKPMHVPLPVNNTSKGAGAQSTAHLRVAGSIYMKPICVPLPVVQRTPIQTVSKVSAAMRVPRSEESANIDASLSSEHVNGQIGHRGAPAPMVATYAAASHPVQTRTGSQGSLASKEVYARLVRP